MTIDTITYGHHSYPLAFKLSDGSYYDAYTGVSLPLPIRAVLKIDSNTLMLVTFRDGEVVFHGLKASAYECAREEVLWALKLLDVSVFEVVQNSGSTFEHYEFHNTAEALAGAFKGWAQWYLLDVVGSVRDNFYECAFSRISTVLGLKETQTSTDSRYFERKGLCDIFRDAALALE